MWIDVGSENSAVCLLSGNVGKDDSDEITVDSTLMDSLKSYQSLYHIRHTVMNYGIKRFIYWM